MIRDAQEKTREEWLLQLRATNANHVLAAMQGLGTAITISWGDSREYWRCAWFVDSAGHIAFGITPGDAIQACRDQYLLATTQNLNGEHAE